MKFYNERLYLYMKNVCIYKKQRLWCSISVFKLLPRKLAIFSLLNKVDYSEDINYSYTFRGSGHGRYVGGMWAVQGLSTSGLSVGQWRVISGSPVGHHQANFHLAHTRPTGVPSLSSTPYLTYRSLVSYITNRARSPLFDIVFKQEFTFSLNNVQQSLF